MARWGNVARVYLALVLTTILVINNARVLAQNDPRPCRSGAIYPNFLSLSHRDGGFDIAARVTVNPAFNLINDEVQVEMRRDQRFQPDLVVQTGQAEVSPDRIATLEYSGWIPYEDLGDAGEAVTVHARFLTLNLTEETCRVAARLPNRESTGSQPVRPQVEPPSPPAP